MVAYASRFREFASNAPLASSWDSYSTLAMNMVPGFVAGDEDKEQRWVPYMQSSVTSPIYIALATFGGSVLSSINHTLLLTGNGVLISIPSRSRRVSSFNLSNESAIAAIRSAYAASFSWKD